MTNYLNAGIYFLAAGAMVLLSTALYELITKYRAWDQIGKGNGAAALSMGGIVVGVANIMHSAISSNDTLLQTMSWGAIGIAALVLVYLAFELFTPKLNVNDELEKGNIAVGILSFAFSIAMSLVISACIM